LGIIGRDAADPTIESAALPHLYTHGKPVEHAVILFHGFTNCPKQFDELARGLYNRGCNVFVPRLPLHGFKDRLTLALANLTVDDLTSCAEEAFSLARGLGSKVSAVGLSLGGAMALWLAQTQPIDLAVPVSPFLSPKGYPEFAGTLAAHALYTIPSMYWWWDSTLKEKCLPLYAYPGYPTHGLAELVFLGDRIFAAANEAAPRARNCVLVTNSNDNAVNNETPLQLIDRWKRRGSSSRQTVLTDLWPPRHDIIDPTTYPQARSLVYPTLENLVLTNGQPA
jgi:alpha-beta hydrolase superfamily lysophospholipase